MLRFAIALLIGALAAGVAGILIGIPVLRLRGDYLAIVTLAFGEIIKNVMNALYLGVDANGWHFSFKDAASLKLGEGGRIIINGCLLYTSRASTTKMAQRRRKQLEKLEITAAPRTHHTDLKFRFEFDVTPYNELLTAKNIGITLGGRELVKALDLQVTRGQRLVIAGPNGAGKSTLLRVLDGKLRPQTGIVRLGAGAKPSIFEQQQLRRGGTVISAIWDKYPRMTELDVRSHLAKLNFRGEDVFKPCAALSLSLIHI